MVGPSPRYVDDDGYVGGFSAEDIDERLDSLDRNYLGWASAMAPVIVGNADRPELSEELTNSFCRTDADRVARAKRRSPGSGVLPDLSERELQIAQLVAAGLKNREIAAELYLSEKTIETYLSKVFRKLGVSSRAQVAVALERSRAVVQQ